MSGQDIALYTGLILTGLNIVDRLSFWKDRSKAPYKELKARMESVEKEIEQMHGYLTNDYEKIGGLEDGGKVLMESMNALLGHGIDGNNIEEMRTSRKHLNEYLINRK